MHDRLFATTSTGLRSNSETDFSRRVLKGQGQVENKSEGSEGVPSVKRPADFGDAENPAAAAADSSGTSSSETAKSAARAPAGNSAYHRPCPQVIKGTKKTKLKSRLRNWLTHFSGFTHRQDATELLSSDRGLSTKKTNRGKILSSICSTPSISPPMDPHQQCETLMERTDEGARVKVSPPTDSSILCKHFREFDPDGLYLSPRLLGSPPRCIGIHPETSTDMITSQQDYRIFILGTEECWYVHAEYCRLAEGDVDNKTETSECSQLTPLGPENARYGHTNELCRHSLTVKIPACVYSNVITPSHERGPRTCKEFDTDSVMSLSENLPQVARMDPHQPGQGADQTVTEIMEVYCGPRVPNMHALSPLHNRLEDMESPPLITGCAADECEVSSASARIPDCLQTNKKVPEIIIQGLRPDDQDLKRSPPETSSLLEKSKDQRMQTLQVPDRSARSPVDSWRFLSADGQLASQLEFAIRQKCLIRPPVTSVLLGRRFHVRQSLGASPTDIGTREMRDGNRVLKRIKNMDLFQPCSKSQSTDSSSVTDWNSMRSEEESGHRKMGEGKQEEYGQPDLLPANSACGTRFRPPTVDTDGRLTTTHTYLPTSSISLSRFLGGHLGQEKVSEFSYLFQSSESTFDMSSSSSSSSSAADGTAENTSSTSHSKDISNPIRMRANDQCLSATGSLESKTSQSSQLTSCNSCQDDALSPCLHPHSTRFESKPQGISPHLVDEGVVEIPEHTTLSALCHERVRCVDRGPIYAVTATVSGEATHSDTEREGQASDTSGDKAAKGTQVPPLAFLSKSPESPHQLAALQRQNTGSRVDCRDLEFDTGKRVDEAGEEINGVLTQMKLSEKCQCRLSGRGLACSGSDQSLRCKNQQPEKFQERAVDHPERIQQNEPTPENLCEANNAIQDRGEFSRIEVQKQDSADDAGTVSASGKRLRAKDGPQGVTLMNSNPDIEAKKLDDKVEQIATCRSANEDCNSICNTLSTELASDVVANVSLTAQPDAEAYQISGTWGNVPECAQMEELLRDLDTRSESPAFSVASSSHLRENACRMGQTVLGVETFHLQLEHEAIFNCITTAAEVNSLQSLTIKESTQQVTPDDEEMGRETAVTVLGEFSTGYSAPINSSLKGLTEHAVQIRNEVSQGERKSCSATASGVCDMLSPPWSSSPSSKQRFGLTAGTALSDLEDALRDPKSRQEVTQRFALSPECGHNKPVKKPANTTDLEIVERMEQAREGSATIEASLSLSSEAGVPPDPNAQSDNIAKTSRVGTQSEKTARHSSTQQTHRRVAVQAHEKDSCSHMPVSEDAAPDTNRRECSPRLELDAKELNLPLNVDLVASALVPPDMESPWPRETMAEAEFLCPVPAAFENSLPPANTHHLDGVELKQACDRGSFARLSGQAQEDDRKYSSDVKIFSSAPQGASAGTLPISSHAAFTDKTEAGHCHLNGGSSSGSATHKRFREDPVNSSRTQLKHGCGNRVYPLHTQGDSHGSSGGGAGTGCHGQPQVHSLSYANKAPNCPSRIEELTPDRQLMPHLEEQEGEEAAQREVESRFREGSEEDWTTREYTVDRAFSLTATAAGKGDETGLSRAGQLMCNFSPALFVPFSDGEDSFRDQEEEEVEDEMQESLHTMSPLHFTRVYCDIETEAATGQTKGVPVRDTLACKRQERRGSALKPDASPGRSRNNFSSHCVDYATEFSELISTRVPSLTRRSLGYGISNADMAQTMRPATPVGDQEGSRTDKPYEVRKLANGVHQPLFVVQPNSFKWTEPRAEVQPPQSKLPPSTHTCLKASDPPDLSQLIAPDAKEKVFLKVVRKPQKSNGLKPMRQIDPQIRERQKRAFMKKIRQLSATRVLCMDQDEMKGWNMNNSCTLTRSKAAWRMESLMEILAKFAPLWNSGNSNKSCIDLIRRKNALVERRRRIRTNWHDSIINRNNFVWDELDGSIQPTIEARYRSITSETHNALHPAPEEDEHLAPTQANGNKGRIEPLPSGFRELYARKNRLMGGMSTSSPGHGHEARRTHITGLSSELVGQTDKAPAQRNGQPQIRPAQQQADSSEAASVLGSGDVSKPTATQPLLQREKQRRQRQRRSPPKDGESMGGSSSTDLPTEVRLEFENAVQQTRTVSAISPSPANTLRHEASDTCSAHDFPWEMEECLVPPPRQLPSTSVGRQLLPQLEPCLTDCSVQLTGKPVPSARTHRLSVLRVPFSTGLSLGISRQVVVFIEPIKRSRPYFRRSHFARTPYANSRYLMRSRTLTFLAIVKSRISTSRTYSLRGLREGDFRRLDEYRNDVVVWTVALNTAVESCCSFNDLQNPDLHSVAQWEYCKTVTQHFVSSNPLPRGALWASW